MHDCIDVHTHVVPASFPAYLGSARDVPWPSTTDAHACHKHIVISGKVYRTVADGCWSVPRRIEHMAACGISRQVLSPMPELLSYWLPLDAAAVLLRYLNEQIAEMVQQASDRFFGLGAVPLQDVDAAIRELQYVMGDLKFAGVEIASHVNDVSIGDARFEPFFAEAARLGAAIFVHGLRPAGQERIVGSFAEQVVCFPGEIALACASMITGGIAARHPNLRIAFSHGGGAMPILLPRLMHAWKVMAKARESVIESPLETVRRFYFDHLVFNSQAVRFLVQTYGASQVLIGSDYPFNMSDPDPLGTLHGAQLDDDVARAVSSTNALRFLGQTAS